MHRDSGKHLRLLQRSGGQTDRLAGARAPLQSNSLMVLEDSHKK